MVLKKCKGFFNNTERIGRDSEYRFREIDCLRSLAIAGMVFFHFCYIFNDLRLINLPIYSGFWWVFPRLVAAGFITLMGLSLTLSLHRAKKQLNDRTLFLKFFRRSLVLAAIALAITLTTWFVFARQLVFFGILHLISLSILLGYPLLRLKFLNLLLAGLVLGGGLLLGTRDFEFYWLLWLGFRPAGYYPVDYLPLLPWFAFVPLGIFLGNWLYPGGRRHPRVPELCAGPVGRVLGFPGRHSLLFYLGHLPLLYGLGLLISWIKTG